MAISEEIDFSADIVDTVDYVVGGAGEELGGGFESPQVDDGFEVDEGRDGGEEGAERGGFGGAY